MFCVGVIETLRSCHEDRPESGPGGHLAERSLKDYVAERYARFFDDFFFSLIFDRLFGA